jgi:hypothetical protein
MAMLNLQLRPDMRRAIFFGLLFIFFLASAGCTFLSVNLVAPVEPLKEKRISG